MEKVNIETRGQSEHDRVGRANISDTIRGGVVSKIDRYKWVSRNQKGELAYVSKHAIQIDHSYQRDLNEGKRQRISSNFNWAAFGAISLCRRKDGSLWCIDGQHRLESVMARSDVADVPAVIFNLGDELRDEATDFLVANKERKALTRHVLLDARLIEGVDCATWRQPQNKNRGFRKRCDCSTTGGTSRSSLAPRHSAPGLVG